MPLRFIQKALQGKRKLEEVLSEAAGIFEAYVWSAANLDSDLSALVEDWHEVGGAGEPAFEGTWVNSGGLYDTAAFYKDPWGVVHIKGRVDTGTINTTIFTLPTGYRPALIPTFNIQSNSLSARLIINSDGTVICTNGSNVWVSLHCSFRAA